jgi:predicted phage terminase large subunit-like protein
MLAELEDITPEEYEALLSVASVEQRKRLESLMAEINLRKTRERAQLEFIPYVESVWPDFISGAHHRRIAKIFERIADGELKRVIINLGPRHTKSEFASYLLPSWFFGRFPKRKVMQISNTGELAEGFGRKVRNLVDSDDYRRIFPAVELRKDSTAAGRWNTNHGGEYFAAGVGGTVTGRGADLLIIDDPHSEGEAVLAQFNPEIYDKVFSWYTSGPRQRLQPGGAIVIVMCMTGDTPVLMASGEERPLRDVRSGDLVATFDNGRLTTSKVNNWQSNGVDSIYKIQTQSGRILRANERHPFLIMNEGVLEWTRLRNLRRGDLLVSLKGATGLREQKPNPESADLAKPATATTAKTQMPQDEGRGTTENGKVKRALSRIARSLCTVTGYAKTITQKSIGRTEKEEGPQSSAAHVGSKAGMESRLMSIQHCSKSKGADAQYAEICPETMFGPIGAANCALTIVTTLEKFGVSSATTAISPLAMVRQQQYLNELQRISDFTADPIVSITPDGEEEVFDVEIDRTENFIANGVVSHNTRWSLRDLTGQILEHSIEKGGDKWEVIEFPAIMNEGELNERPLWPEFWSLKELQAVKAELPPSKWAAQYQQQPTSETNAIIKRDWWRKWPHKNPPPPDFILMTLDTAFEKKNSADYSAIVVFGVWNNDEDDGQPNLMLLDAYRERMEFPVLKERLLEYYEEWEPDSVIIEKKASGAPLIYEMRRMGVPVGEFTPTRGNDKITRLNAVADIFASGKVWAPQTRWADELIDEVASFPSGRHDDFVDCVSLALMRFRQGGFIGTTKDEEEESLPRYRSSRGYY